MTSPAIARLLGYLFLIAGIAAFVPYVTVAPAFDAQVVSWNDHYVMLFGLFPVNLGHDIIHLFFAFWGLFAATRFRSALMYCRCVAVIYGVIALLGLIPITNTLFGIVPLYGHDIWLHALFALIAFWGGYGRPAYAQGPPPQAPA
jgi:hypothetical protein